MHQSQIKCVVLTEKFSLQSNMENMYHHHNIRNYNQKLQSEVKCEWQEQDGFH